MATKPTFNRVTQLSRITTSSAHKEIVAITHSSYKVPSPFLTIPFQTGYCVDMQSSPDLLPGTLFLLILRTIARGPLHGYAIAKRIKECSSGVLEVEEGSLYPALQRMMIKGWLKAEWGVSESGRRARFYQLTPEGRKQLASERKGFERMIGAITEVLETA
jgi:transcriptional regulator